MTVSTSKSKAIMILRNPICNMHIEIACCNSLSEGKCKQPTENSWISKFYQDPIQGKEVMKSEFIISKLPYYILQKGISLVSNSLPMSPEIKEQFALLDNITVYDTKRIGVYYIPKNSNGFTEPTQDFMDFVKSIGTLSNVLDGDNNNYKGGLPNNGADDKFIMAYRKVYRI